MGRHSSHTRILVFQRGNKLGEAASWHILTSYLKCHIIPPAIRYISSYPHLQHAGSSQVGHQYPRFCVRLAWHSQVCRTANPAHRVAINYVWCWNSIYCMVYLLQMIEMECLVSWYLYLNPRWSCAAPAGFTHWYSTSQAFDIYIYIYIYLLSSFMLLYPSLFPTQRKFWSCIVEAVVQRPCWRDSLTDYWRDPDISIHVSSITRYELPPECWKRSWIVW